MNKKHKPRLIPDTYITAGPPTLTSIPPHSSVMKPNLRMKLSFSATHGDFQLGKHIRASVVGIGYKKKEKLVMFFTECKFQECICNEVSKEDFEWNHKRMVLILDDSKKKNCARILLMR